ncbi:MAG: GEVED domain-containing protein [Flavobacteriales bacterium]
MKKRLPKRLINFISKSAAFFIIVALSLKLSAQTHCIPTVGTSCTAESNSRIVNFTLATINNPSGCSPNSYGDYFDAVQFPNIEATLNPGTSYPFSVTRATADFASPYSVRVWIDLNENGTFDDAGEMVASLNMATLCGFVGCTNVVHNGNLTVPAGTSPGTKRLRVRIFFNISNGQPCGNHSYGETEDYRIIIPGGASSITTNAITPLNYCPEQSVQIPFSLQGTFNAGNVFTAQLSDANGNFTTPVNIGTLSGTSAGTINATIPQGTAAGAGYRIRIVSSDPQITGTDNGANITINTLPVLTITSVSANSVCAGGSVSIAANAGGANIIWQQSNDGTNFNDISGAQGQNFSSTPINSDIWFRASASNSCGTVFSEPIAITVAQTSSVTISLNPSLNNLCNGPITLSVPNGIANFVWSNAQSGTSITVSTPGTYSGSGTDASGCAVNATPVEIIQTTPTPLTTDPSGAVNVCAGPVNIEAAGGFSNYVWNGTDPGASFSATASGSYSVTATDANGCQSTSAAVIVNIDNSNTVPIEVTPSGLVTFCEGENVTLTAATGFNGYIWSDGTVSNSLTVSQSGTYSVVAITPDGCVAVSEDIVVIEIDAPVPSFTYSQTTGYTVQFSNTTQFGNSYVWNFGGGNTSTQENPSFTFPFDGTYPVTLTVTNSCGTASVTVNVVVEKLSVREIDGLSNFEVFPNPAQGSFQIKFETNKPKQIRIRLMNALSQTVSDKSVTVNGQYFEPFNIRNLASGVYILSLEESSKRNTIRIVVN